MLPVRSRARKRPAISAAEDLVRYKLHMTDHDPICALNARDFLGIAPNSSKSLTSVSSLPKHRFPYADGSDFCFSNERKNSSLASNTSDAASQKGAISRTLLDFGTIELNFAKAA